MVKNQRITVLYRAGHRNNSFSVLYGLLQSRYSGCFDFTSSLDFVLNADKNDYVLLVDFFESVKLTGSIFDTLGRLRNKYERMCYFSGNDSCQVIDVEYLEFFDLWFKKQIYKDYDLNYLDFIDGRIFSDFYMRSDDQAVSEIDDSAAKILSRNIHKLRVGWNILCSMYPVSDFARRLVTYGTGLLSIKGVNLVLPRIGSGFNARGARKVKCSARFAYQGYSNAIGYQRRMFEELIRSSPKNFLYGRVSSRGYKREISEVGAVLSPFGWGEICYRDGEAFRAGAVLIKPSIEHLDTWPNIYLPDETFVPIAWNGSDLLDKVDDLLRSGSEMSRLSDAGTNLMREYLKSFDDRVGLFLTEVVEGV